MIYRITFDYLYITKPLRFWNHKLLFENLQVYPSCLCSKMSEKDYNNSSLNAPLLTECKLEHSIDHEEKIIASHLSNKNELSFLRTCINGLNAIAGLIRTIFWFSITIFCICWDTVNILIIFVCVILIF